MNRFYPPLTAAEKPALLAAIAGTWGCDDQVVLEECLFLIERKKRVERILRAALEPRQRTPDQD